MTICGKQGNTPPLLELLYTGYTEYQPIDNECIRGGFEKLRSYYQHMSDQEFDDLFSQISDLCCAHEYAAFLAGIRVGVHLAKELEL